MTRRPSTRTLVALGLLVALLLAGVVSFYASRSPDGLNRVAEDHGFADTAKKHPAEHSPLAGYETKGVANGRLSGGFAGVVGALVVLALAGGLALVVRRRGRPDDRAGLDDPGRDRLDEPGRDRPEQPAGDALERRDA